MTNADRAAAMRSVSEAARVLGCAFVEVDRAQAAFDAACAAAHVASIRGAHDIAAGAEARRNENIAARKCIAAWEP